MKNLREYIKKQLAPLLKESFQGNIFYRATTEFKGENIIFEPKGYYEQFDDEGNPIFLTGDIFSISDTPEIAASKTVGGALLGAWSMVRHHGNINDNFKIYLYTINDTPDKDLSHVTIDDFEYLKEVRYKRPVKGVYAGYYIFDKSFNESATLFYERFSMDPWDEFTDEQIEMWDAFENFISTANESILRK